MLFAVTAHPILLSLKSKFIIGYLDDLTAGDVANVLADDFDQICEQAGNIGLSLNVHKCEIISNTGFSNLPQQFNNFKKIIPEESELLGAPLINSEALSRALDARCSDLARASNRLKLLSTHDALLILKHSLSSPKVLYLLRCSPCTGHDALDVFDANLRLALSGITNVDISDQAWIQASLPVAQGA